MRLLSKTQIDRLGARLRDGSRSEEDLRALDEYRRSFGEAYDGAVSSIRRALRLEPTGRPAKSTTSIAAKLQRETIRLSQIQDIAGCRLVVRNAAGQERVVERLKTLFAAATVVDRRRRPSHGYRAVHALVTQGNRTIEVQIRTKLQHLWAEVCEKLSDVVDPAIKYGGGPPHVVQTMTDVSETIAGVEDAERAHRARRRRRLAARTEKDEIRRVKKGLVDLLKDIADSGIQLN